MYDQASSIFRRSWLQPQEGGHISMAQTTLRKRGCMANFRLIKMVRKIVKKTPIGYKGSMPKWACAIRCAEAGSASHMHQQVYKTAHDMSFPMSCSLSIRRLTKKTGPVSSQSWSSHIPKEFGIVPHLALCLQLLSCVVGRRLEQPIAALVFPAKVKVHTAQKQCAGQSRPQVHQVTGAVVSGTVHEPSCYATEVS